MVKLFEIVLDAPPSPRGFLSGSELTGKLVVEVDETKSYRFVEISLVGSGKVKWTEEGEDGETHRATEEYARESKTLWGGEDTNEDHGSFSAGRHEFPFALSVPASCPSSWEAELGASGTDAWVRYVLTGRIRPKGALKIDHTTEKRINIVTELRLPRDSLEPVRHQAEALDRWLCCASGTVALAAELPQSGFTAREQIPVFVEVENGSSRDLTCEAALVERVRLRAGRHLKKTSKTVAKKTSYPLGAGSTVSWSCEVPAVLEGRTSMETLGGMIMVSYEVKVCVGLRLGHRVKVILPVVVGNADCSQ